MKELSKQDKDAIRDALLEYCGNYGSADFPGWQAFF